MSNLSLPFEEQHNHDCQLRELLDPGDNICYDTLGDGRYQVIDERSPLVADALADIKGLALDNVVAKPLTYQHVAPSFIPVMTRGKLLTEHYAPPFAAVMLDDVVSPTLKVHPDVRQRLNLPDSTKLIMLGYGKDYLIERVWPNHPHIYRQLVDAGIDLFVPPNYSIWHSQPHLERLINIKRSLIVYETMQSLGLEAIPHVYWFGKRDIERWAALINASPNIKAIAINLQTIGSNERPLWQQSMEELRYLRSLLQRPLHYLISGPQAFYRMRDVINAVGADITFTNANAAIKAWNSRLLTARNGGFGVTLQRDTHKSVLFDTNVAAYNRTITAMRNAFVRQQISDSVGRSSVEVDERVLQWFRSRQQKANGVELISGACGNEVGQ